MTPATQPAQLANAVLAWAFTAVCQASLWKIGYAGPTVWTIFLGSCAAASIFLLGWGLFGLRSAAKKVAIANLVIAMGTACAVGFFVFQVLSNEDGPIPVWSPKPYVDGKTVPTVRTKIRLFNLNVLHGYPDFEKQNHRYRDIVTEFKRLDADILVLQETWTVAPDGCMAERLGLELRCNFAYARANGLVSHIGFEEGGAILSRFPILEAKRIQLKPRSPWWENRVALQAKLDFQGLTTLTVVGVHLSNSPSADAQAEYLLDILRESPPDFLVGDFNSLPDSQAVKAIVKEGYIEAVPRNETAEPWIDHVILSPRSQKLWALTDTSWVIATQPVPNAREAISDHDGILVELDGRWR